MGRGSAGARFRGMGRGLVGARLRVRGSSRGHEICMVGPNMPNPVSYECIIG